MIVIRSPESIYQAHGTIQNGTFQGRWHFSFDEYYSPLPLEGRGQGEG